MKARVAPPRWTSPAAGRFVLVAGLATFVGIVVRICGIARLPLAGDEYNTIDEIRRVGLNWNSLPYFAFMHHWAGIGASDWWLRLPSAVASGAIVPATAVLGRTLAGVRAGLVAAWLAALSPFLVYHAQEVRFYSAFVLAATLFAAVTATTVGQRRWATAAAGVFLVSSHYLGSLAGVCQWLGARVAARSGPARRRLALAATAAIVAGPLFLTLPPVRQFALAAYTAVSNTDTVAAATIRPLTALALVKGAFAGFVFVFGYHVYPFWLWLTLPGAAVVAWCGATGLAVARRAAWLPMVGFTTLGLTIVVLVLDPLGGSVAMGAAPRHVAFAWPLFAVTVAAGATSLPRPAAWIATAAMLSTQVIGLGARWINAWSYHPHPEVRAAAALLTPGCSLAADRDAARALGRYARGGTHPGVDPLLPQSIDPPVLVASLDESGRMRAAADATFAELARSADLDAAIVDYPLVAGRFLPRAGGTRGLSVRANGWVRMPVETPPRILKDLRLPASVTVAGFETEVASGVVLGSEEPTRIWPLAAPVTARAATLVATVLGEPRPGAEVLRLVLASPQGSTVLPVRADREIAAWRAECPTHSACRTVLAFGKRVDLVGASAYPGAWRQFGARVHAVSMPLPAPVEVAGVTFELLAGQPRVLVLGLRLEAP